jgi:transposase
MRTVDDFAAIRQAHRDGLSMRQIAKRLNVGRDTVRKALQHPEPPPYTLSQPRPAPTFGPFRQVVDAIVAADATAPRKQRHTAAQIYRRLQAEHGYPGSYDQVRRYLQEQRLRQRETFIPLDHPPGHRAEADFGHIYVDFPAGRQQVPVLLLTWSYSNAPFAVALPTERTEAVLHGLVEAFAFFGCVPRELWWDNPTTVAITVLQGRDRHLHPRYAALASHYTFTPKFCMPAKATEKPRVEHRVFDLQRRWATPVPQLPDRAALNAHLRQCCVVEQQRVSGRHPDTVGTRFAQDQAAALPLPAQAFDACVLRPAQVDKYQTVQFDRNAYSVPRRWAFRPVTVKGYIDAVAVVADGQVVARHARSYDRGVRVLDPLHYLVTLEHKPAALDHAPVYRDWQLPPGFAVFRQALEQRLGPRTGARHFIRILQLLARHPLPRVTQALQACQERGTVEAAAVAAQVERQRP